MFKVKNCSNNAIALSLEKGSTILQPGKSLDIDGLCSRHWIRENKELAHLLNPNVNALVLMHDSETGVVPQITHDARKHPTKSKPKKKEKPVIIDFSDVGEPEQDDPIVEDLSEPEDVIEDVVESLVEKECQPCYEDDKTPADTDCAKCEADEEMVIEEPTWEEEKLADGMVACPVCSKPCKGKRGLRAHMRSHKD